VTFFSMLEKPLIVSNGVFEKELFIPGVPSEARKQIRSFKLDGSNFLWSVGGTSSSGQYDGVWWYKSGNALQFCDPRINRNESGTGAVSEVFFTSSKENLKEIHTTLHLGFPPMKPGSVQWTEDHRHFTAKKEDGSDLSVDVTLENDLPVVATIHGFSVLAEAKSGDDLIFKYSYAPSFFEGKVPSEITVYQDAAYTRQQKLVTIRLLALEITDKHLPNEAIDPNQLFEQDSITFYSNNIAYWIKPNGKASRVLTLDEARQQTRAFKARDTKP